MSGKIKVALVHADPGYGGGHKHVVDLAANLSSTFEPTVIAASKDLLDLGKKAGVATAPIPKSRFAGFEDVRPLRELFTEWQFALVHAHGPRAGWASSLATRRMGLPFVYTDHAWNPDYRIRATNAALQMVGLRFVCRVAAKVIAVSEASQNFLVGRGISQPGKTIIIPNGIDLARLPKAKPHTITTYPLVGSVGVFTARKGHDVLVEAASLVLPKNPRVHFCIIGDGPERMATERLAIDLGVRRFFHFTGALNDKERDKERQKWTLYVQSSRDESFGIAAAEALAMEIPVVGTKVGGLPDVIDGGGIIVQKDNPAALAEAILKLLADKKLREKLAKTGSEHVRKHFDLENVVKQIEKIYLDVT